MEGMRRIRFLRLVGVVMVIGGFIALLAFGFTRNPKEIPSPLIGKPAPSFTLSLLNGGTLSLEAFRGKVVVVNFWASWCFPACWNEAPRLEAAWQRYKEKGVVILGIVYQDTEERAREFIKRFGKTYPNGLDLKSRIAIDYGVYGVPETFFVDRQGRIMHKHVGEIQMETLVAKIEELLPVAWSSECEEWIDFTVEKIRAREGRLPTREAGVWLEKAGTLIREAGGLCGKDEASARAKFNEAWVILGQLNR